MTHSFYFGIKASSVSFLALILLAAVMAAPSDAFSMEPPMEPPGAAQEERRPWKFLRVVLETPEPIAAVTRARCGSMTGPVVRGLSGRLYGFRGSGTRWRLARLSGCGASPGHRFPDMLPDGEIVDGGGAIRRVWLIGPTTRYGHGILGDAIEAAGLALETRRGRRLEFRLPADSVFEDRRVRLVRLKHGGPERLLAIRSRLRQGAALSLFAVGRGKITLLAESEPFGLSNRWLNPVGVADFDGDGRREIAAVLTPHIGGTLTLYEKKGRRLVAKLRARGFSNHAIGSRNLDLSALLDANGDGVTDMAVPDDRRETLRIVTFAGGRFQELMAVPNRAEITAGILKTALPRGGNAVLIYALENRRVVLLFQ
ncbi:MAG: hypothetical protein V3S64_17075 [bacterium]